MPFKQFGFLGNEIEKVKQNIRKDFEQFFNLIFEVNEFTLKIISEIK
jgi:hypothetical protein